MVLAIIQSVAPFPALQVWHVCLAASVPFPCSGAGGDSQAGLPGQAAVDEFRGALTARLWRGRDRRQPLNSSRSLLQCAIARSGLELSDQV